MSRLAHHRPKNGYESNHYHRKRSGEELLETARNGSKRVETARNGSKRIETVRSGSKRVETVRNLSLIHI
eukprot:14213909-Alexandrium_andersonii.AAC.1